MHYKKNKYMSPCLFFGANRVPQSLTQGSIAFASVYVDNIEKEERETTIVEEY